MPRSFHLALFRPDHPRFRIMDCHLEVMESLRWGFEACGINCSVAINRFDHGRTNIVFGWIMAAQMGALDSLPDDTILYNFEQFSERRIADTGIGQLARRFQIWDYSAANLPRWAECAPRFTPFHAPVSHAPSLQRLPAVTACDIDLLFIGSAADGRHTKLNEISSDLSRPGLVTLQNVWGDARDGFIARSRVLLNLSNDNPLLRIFEIVRVSYYLANHKPVVCELVPGQHIEDDLRDALLFVPRAELPATCARLLADPAEAGHWAARGHEAFARRDVRQLLRRWLG
jgi:hypothetical protein